HLADTKQSNGQDNEFNAIQQPDLTEVEARNAVLLVDADGAEQQSRNPCRKAFEQGPPNGSQRRESQGHQRKILGRSEGQSGFGERWSEQGKAEGRQGAGDE